MQWLDEYMKLLAKHEGTKPAKATEGGGYTRGYGITTLAENFIKSLAQTRNVTADELSDKELAREYVIWNAQQIEKRYPNYNEWPDSVKMAAVDLAYNGGSLGAFTLFDKGLKEGNWQEAMRQTLDIVGANDPKTSERAVLRGLGNRRLDFYNMVADEVGFAKINGLKAYESQKGTLFSYETDDGNIDIDIARPLHSASGSYDVKKKSRPAVDLSSPDDMMLEEPEVVPDVPETKSFEVGEEGDLGTEPTATPEIQLDPEDESTIVDEEPEDETLQLIPTPEEGSYDAIFGVPQFGVQQAEDSFVMPEEHEPDDYTSTTVQRERQIQLDADQQITVREQNPFTPQRKGYQDIPKPSDILQTQDGPIQRRYGNVMHSRMNEDQYDYDMFMPTEAQGFGAAFRQFNVIPNLAEMFGRMMDPKMRSVNGYEAYNDDKLKKLVGEENLFFFRHSGSHNQSMSKYKRMAEDYEDMKLLERYRGKTGASIIATLSDHSILLPMIPTKLSGASRMRRFGRGAMTGYATTVPQQVVIEKNNESRDADAALVGVMAASFLSGALSAGMGKSFTASQLARVKIDQDNFRTNFLGKESKYTAEQMEELKSVYAAGADVSPEIARTNMYRQLEAEGLAETGIGIEKLGWNPTIRLFKSQNPIVRNLVPDMVDVGGLMQKKVLKDVEMGQSVETTFRTTYLPGLRTALNEVDKQFMMYRNKGVKDYKLPQTDIGMAGRKLATGFGDIKDEFFNARVDKLTEVQFRNRVGMAMRRGDVDDVGDAASAYVTAAAKEARKQFEKIKNEANSPFVRLFESEIKVEIAKATKAGLTKKVDRLKRDLQKLRDEGVTVSTATSYLPRIYRVDKIEQNVGRFLGIVKGWAMKTKGMDARTADNFAAQVLDSVTRRRPYIDYEDATDALDWIKNPSGVQRRSLEIPDELIEEFLENDIEALLRRHTMSMGMDIELTRKFGSTSMDDVLRQVTNEYQKRIDETKDFGQRSKLAEGMENDLRDIRGLRDRLRGTYGASKDPHSMSSRFTRVMKSFNVLTGMGSAMVSSVPDIARIAMVEGFTNAYAKGFATLFDEQARIIRTMNKKELDHAAVGVDAVLGLRAQALTDMGDIFGNRYTIERGLNAATGMFFIMNGLNIWNQVLKEMAGNVVSLRMTDSFMRKGGWNQLSRIEKNKLLKNGISRQDYDIIRRSITEHGQKQGNEWLPNTEAWAFPQQRLKFRNALNQQVERIIITPGAGDRALWTSTEFGSLLTQFKSYGQGAMVRMLTAGLQEKDAAFWQGAFLIVGLAAMVNEIKRAQYGLTSNESFDQKLINAVDRSGLLGWFTDVNNGIEKLSDYQLGLRPFLTDQQQYPVHATAKASAVAGPTASAILNALSVTGDMATGSFDHQSAKDLRFIYPTGNLFYLDPIYDGVFGEGNVNRQPEANRR